MAKSRTTAAIVGLAAATLLFCHVPDRLAAQTAAHAGAVPPGSGPSNMELCVNKDKQYPANGVVIGCTALIQAGTYSGHDLAVLFILRGDGYYDEGEYVRANADFAQALQIEPANEDALVNRGITDPYAGNTDLGIRDETHAIALSPTDGRAYFGRGYAYTVSGRFKDAIDDLTVALALRPTEAELIRQDRGFAYAAIGDGERALQDFNAALTIGGGGRTVDANVYADRGFTRYYSGHRNEGIADLKRAADLNPGTAYDLELYALAPPSAGDPDAADRLARVANQTNEKADRLQPMPALETYWPIPIVDLYRGTASVTSVIEAARTDPNRCEAGFYLGEWELHHNDRALARGFFRMAAAKCAPDQLAWYGATKELQRFDGADQGLGCSVPSVSAYFAAHSATLLDEAKVNVVDAARRIRRCRLSDTTVILFTQHDAAESPQPGLSHARAMAIVSALVESGIPRSIVQIKDAVDPRLSRGNEADPLDRYVKLDVMHR